MCLENVLENHNKFYNISKENIMKIIKYDSNIDEITFEVIDENENSSFEILDTVDFMNEINTENLLPL